MTKQRGHHKSRKLREHKLGPGYREKMQSIIIIARNARVKQKADSVLIISKAQFRRRASAVPNLIVI